MSKNSEDLTNKTSSKDNSIPDLKTLSAVTFGINAGLVATQYPVTLLSYIGARMTSRNENLGLVSKEALRTGVPGVRTRMMTSLRRRAFTFGLPYPVIKYASQQAGIENPIFPSVFATALETAIASSPKFGSEVAERFGLVNGQLFSGIRGTLFTMTKEEFQSQFSKLEHPQRCASYEKLEELRQIVRQNKIFNRAALTVRNFSFFAAIGAKEVVQQKVDEGLIDKADQESYEMAARFSASVMSVFPDVLFTYIASGRMPAKDAIKSLPETFIKNFRTLPIIPRIITCYIGAMAANYGFDFGKKVVSDEELEEEEKTLKRVNKANVKQDETDYEKITQEQKIQELKKEIVQLEINKQKLASALNQVKISDEEIKQKQIIQDLEKEIEQLGIDQQKLNSILNQGKESHEEISQKQIIEAVEKEIAQLEINEKEIMDLATDVVKDQIPQMTNLMKGFINQPLGWEEKSEGEFMRKVMEMTLGAHKEIPGNRGVKEASDIEEIILPDISEQLNEKNDKEDSNQEKEPLKSQVAWAEESNEVEFQDKSESILEDNNKKNPTTSPSQTHSRAVKTSQSPSKKR